MAIKKSELYSTLWKSCDELRGGMDASQYKDYILVLLFVKYISDRYGDDEEAVIEVPKGDKPGQGGSFQDMVFWKNKSEIGDQLNIIIGRLAKANDLTGIITVANFNDPEKLGKGKDMVDRLSNLIALFENPQLNFSKNRADGDDILGDAYEYLMRHFATESGKSKGQFYTPSEVSHILAKVVGVKNAKRADQTIYDPTCGSGSLLLKAADEAPISLSLYGQEKDNATRALAVMNMWLHNNPDAVIWQDNTLSAPHFKNKTGGLETFDFIVANPPFSDKAWSNGFDPVNDLFGRFQDFGIPPAKNGDYAYLLHIIRSLKSKGTGAVILPHGVLFRGNAEATIRQNLIQRGYIKGIIGLPPNLFYGTGIPACIIVLDKALAASRRGIFMIDASKGFVKDGNKNRLREQDIHRIVDVFEKQTELPGYARLVPYQEIETNAYNLNIPRYIDSQEVADVQDIEAHLRGGIPSADLEQLAPYWAVFPELRKALFAKEKGRKNYNRLKVANADIKDTIFTHPEFVAFLEDMNNVFAKWEKKQLKFLKKLNGETRPNDVIAAIAESVLKSYTGKALVDKYDMYQHVMDYWEETMKDDCYIISEDGWKAEVYLLYTDKARKKAKGWDCDLLPKDLVIHRFFKEEKKAILALAEAEENAARQKSEIEEEHGGESGLLAEVLNDKGKVNKAMLTKRMKAIKEDPDEAEEFAVLEKWNKANEAIASTKKKVAAAEKALDKKLADRYKILTEAEVKLLVTEDKWMASLQQAIGGELDRVSQSLAQRIKVLAERYDTPLSQLEDEATVLKATVLNHLEKMGMVW